MKHFWCGSEVVRCLDRMIGVCLFQLKYSVFIPFYSFLFYWCALMTSKTTYCLSRTTKWNNVLISTKKKLIFSSSKLKCWMWDRYFVLVIFKHEGKWKKKNALVLKCWVYFISRLINKTFFHLTYITYIMDTTLSSLTSPLCF